MTLAISNDLCNTFTAIDAYLYRSDYITINNAADSTAAIQQKTRNRKNEKLLAQILLR